MRLPIKSILSCLVILTTASDIHTKLIQESGSTQKLAVLNNNIAVLGDGVEPGQIPIVTFPLSSTSFDVSIYIQTKKQCSFGFPGRKGTEVDAKTVQQLARNVIVFVWDLPSDTSIISVFHMDTCVNKKNLQFKRDQSIIRVVVPFANGFHVFSSDNSRATYDADGNLVRQKIFPLNSQDFSISAVSPGFYVVDGTHQVLNLFLIDGASVTQLLKLNYVPMYTNNQQSLYSLCSFDLDPNEFIVHCFQYDELGHEKWRNKVAVGFTGNLQGKLYVKNLAGGELVFIAYVHTDRQMCFVKMGPTQANIWRYFGKQIFYEVKLVDFNEKYHTFVLAYKTNLIEQGISEASVVLQQFSLV